MGLLAVLASLVKVNPWAQARLRPACDVHEEDLIPSTTATNQSEEHIFLQLSNRVRTAHHHLFSAHSFMINLLRDCEPT